MFAGMSNVFIIVITIFAFQTGHLCLPDNGTVRNPAASYINYPEQGGAIELPVRGATGWAASKMPLRVKPEQGADVVLLLSPGQGFTIIKEQGDWWNVRIGGYGGISGWVPHSGCFINLPDVIPSLVFDITNAYSSSMRSMGHEIPDITGYALYEAWAFNRRLDRHEFIVPALYATSKRIFAAQQAALADGNTIIIYEAFRPRETQQRVVDNLRRLMDANAEVRNAINSPPWGLGWFISTGVSNHQRGVAIDVGLGRIVASEIRASGAYAYTHVTAFERHEMPTPIHELSPQAATFTRPVSSSSACAWRNAVLARGMTEGAVLLQHYLTDTGFTPLASEWWHFNDLDGARAANEIGITGGFFTDSLYSETPTRRKAPSVRFAHWQWVHATKY